MTNSLPNPKEFQSHNLSYSSKVQNSTSKYDIYSINYHTKKYYRENQDKLFQEVVKLFDENIILSNPIYKDILSKYLGYNHKYKSLSINLCEIETIPLEIKNHSNKIVKQTGTTKRVPKTVTIQRVGTTKWLTYGTKNFIAHDIKDNFVFIVYGMSEIILCELLGISFVAFQSDGIAKNLTNNKYWENIKPLLEDKSIILLIDNDESCKSTIEPIKSELEDTVREVLVFGFEKMLNKTLTKGYDFRDYCNDLATIKKEKTNNKIIESIKDEYKRIKNV